MTLEPDEQEDRLAFKLAILRCGCWQYQVAQAAGVSEGRLSPFLRGRADLRPEQRARLQAVLGLEEITVDTDQRVIV